MNDFLGEVQAGTWRIMERKRCFIGLPGRAAYASSATGSLNRRHVSRRKEASVLGGAKT